MGSSALQHGLAAGVDVPIAGRACDTGIFASLPMMLGLPAVRLDLLRARGRDSILATLDASGFELESMAPGCRATPVSVAAHSLNEQSDPYTVQEPEGRLDLRQAHYEAIDDRRTQVSGAESIEADARCIKLEGGGRRIGEHAVLLCAAAESSEIGAA
jgi:hypothetical protein